MAVLLDAMSLEERVPLEADDIPEREETLAPEDVAAGLEAPGEPVLTVLSFPEVFTVGLLDIFDALVVLGLGETVTAEDELILLEAAEPLALFLSEEADLVDISDAVEPEGWPPVALVKLEALNTPVPEEIADVAELPAFDDIEPIEDVLNAEELGILLEMAELPKVEVPPVILEPREVPAVEVPILLEALETTSLDEMPGLLEAFVALDVATGADETVDMLVLPDAFALVGTLLSADVPDTLPVNDVLALVEAPTGPVLPALDDAILTGSLRLGSLFGSLKLADEVGALEGVPLALLVPEAVPTLRDIEA